MIFKSSAFSSPAAFENTRMGLSSQLVDLILNIFGEPKSVNEYSGQVSVDCPVCSYEIKGLSKTDGKVI